MCSAEIGNQPITEEWDNREDCEEHDGGLEVTAVHDTAEQARRAALIIAASCPEYGQGGSYRRVGAPGSGQLLRPL